MTFKSKTIYPLKDPERYDDEYGQGFDHVETFGDCDGMYITDCWVVNIDGQVHPGYESDPVPIRFDDVGAPISMPALNEKRKRRASLWG